MQVRVRLSPSTKRIDEYTRANDSFGVATMHDPHTLVFRSDRRNELGVQPDQPARVIKRMSSRYANSVSENRSFFRSPRKRMH